MYLLFLAVWPDVPRRSRYALIAEFFAVSHISFRPLVLAPSVLFFSLTLNSHTYSRTRSYRRTRTRKRVVQEAGLKRQVARTYLCSRDTETRKRIRTHITHATHSRGSRARSRIRASCQKANAFLYRLASSFIPSRRSYL